MRRVEVGAKLCLRTLASAAATSDKFSFIYGQYLLAGKKDIFHIRTTPLATSFRRIFYVYHHAMKYLYTNISLSIFSTNPVIKRKTEFLN